MSESNSPVRVNIDQFDEPSQMVKAYCSQITVEEYEDQTATETEKALSELMAYIGQNPDSYMKVLQKRKREQQENAGMMSYLKVKMMSMFNGGVYPGSLITSDELNEKVSHLKTGMKKAFDYSQETKGRRTSKRLAEKKTNSKVQQDENSRTLVAHDRPTNSSSAPPPPPPPPPPLPTSFLDSSLSHTPTNLSSLVRKPLGDINSQTSTTTQHKGSQSKKTHVSRALRSDMKRISTSSLSSLNSELNSSNPTKRLRATGLNKSPGGTPISRRKMARQGSACSIGSGNFGTPLQQCLVNILEEKFRHVRSPSPVGRFNNAVSPASSFINQGGFTP